MSANIQPSYQAADRRPIASAFRRLATSSVAWCCRNEIHPNTVSYASVVAAGLAATCFAFSGSSPTTIWLLMTGSFFCYVRLFFNMLDGMVAIESGKASATGEIANELPDRISDVLIFAGVAMSGLCNPVFAYWVIIFSLLVAYVGTLGKAAGAHRDFAGPMSKPWRMVALHVGATVALFHHSPTVLNQAVQLSTLDWTCLFIIGGCLITTVRRVRNIVANLNAQQENQ